MSSHDMDDDSELNQDALLGSEASDLPDDGSPVGPDGDETAYYAPESGAGFSKGTIAMLAILGAAGIFTYFMYVRSGAQSANAATDPKAQQVIKQFMSDRDRSFAQMQKMLRDTDAVVKQFLTYPSVTQVPLAELRTNPFRVSAPADEGQPTANRRDEEREKKRREEERVTVLKAVQALQLQSVIHSDARKACMINNTMYQEGQQVESFTIEKIAPNKIVVRNGSYRFELRMQR